MAILFFLKMINKCLKGEMKPTTISLSFRSKITIIINESTLKKKTKQNRNTEGIKWMNHLSWAVKTTQHASLHMNYRIKYPIQ